MKFLSTPMYMNDFTSLKFAKLGQKREELLLYNNLFFIFRIFTTISVVNIFNLNKFF